jgi:hypothetical protein
MWSLGAIFGEWVCPGLIHSTNRFIFFYVMKSTILSNPPQIGIFFQSHCHISVNFYLEMGPFFFQGPGGPAWGGAVHRGSGHVVSGGHFRGVTQPRAPFPGKV